MAHRVDRIRLSGTPDFDVGNHEEAVALGPQPHHLQPMFRRCETAVRLVGRHRSRDEINEVEGQRLAILLGRAQMTDVNRIKAAAEESYAHAGIAPAARSLIFMSFRLGWIRAHIRIWP